MEGKPIWKLVCIASDDQVRQLLEAQSFAVQPVETYNFRERVRTETEGMMAALQQVQQSGFRPIWTKLKEYLTDLFHGKCA